MSLNYRTVAIEEVFWEAGEKHNLLIPQPAGRVAISNLLLTTRRRGKAIVCEWMLLTGSKQPSP